MQISFSCAHQQLITCDLLGATQRTLFVAVSLYFNVASRCSLEFYSSELLTFTFLKISYKPKNNADKKVGLVVKMIVENKAHSTNESSLSVADTGPVSSDDLLEQLTRNRSWKYTALMMSLMLVWTGGTANLYLTAFAGHWNNIT